MTRQQRLLGVAIVAAAAVLGHACVGRRTLVASGRFEGQSGSGGGTAALYRFSDGGLVMELDSPVAPQPGLEVRLIPAGGVGHEDESGFLVIARLSGTQPIQRHPVPPGIDLERYGAVCIWSRVAGAPVATAPLTHLVPGRSRP